ncbi:2553_t:CDS:2, partial [Cetraspora pellucida]
EEDEGVTGVTGDKISEDVELSFSKMVRDVEIEFSQDERVGIKFVREVSKVGFTAA